MTIYYVYIHRTQDTNEVFYIGKGTARRRFLEQEVFIGRIKSKSMVDSTLKF